MIVVGVRDDDAVEPAHILAAQAVRTITVRPLPTSSTSSTPIHASARNYKERPIGELRRVLKRGGAGDEWENEEPHSLPMPV